MLGVGDTKCGICKPKLGIYKPYWAVRRIGRNFAASIWASARIDCEVDASFYEAGSEGQVHRFTSVHRFTLFFCYIHNAIKDMYIEELIKF